ncbi:MAG: glycosyltransferase family 4 protein, partial [Acidimicrobiia bacterium]|nr:glycosyltransferase family 4 protein [Acidimicrobiia bacterium]
KGIRLLIDAAALAGDRGCSVTITVVGAPSGPADETYADEARRRAQELGVTVNWAGWQDDVAPFLSDADVFALVSDREGLPGAALEAMAAGLAVLVTDTGPIADLVRSTGSGVVVEQGDVSAVAARLVDLTTDPDATATMGQRGAYAAESFSPEATDAAFGAILNLMSPRSSRSFGAVR